MSDKYVVVQGFAGLGNRLRTVAAGLEYAQRTKRKICVNWRDGMFAPIGVNSFPIFFNILDYPNVNIQDIDRSLSIYPPSFSYEMFSDDIRKY